jgi:acetyl-CoA C-acetyltransferase
VRKTLKKANVTLSDIGLVELNEAFASQSIACVRELKFDMEKTNVNGSGISIGHPIGCSGARLIVTLLHEMKRRKVNLGLATLCIGGGQGMAMVVEKS